MGPPFILNIYSGALYNDILNNSKTNEYLGTKS